MDVDEPVQFAEGRVFRDVETVAGLDFNSVPRVGDPVLHGDVGHCAGLPPPLLLAVLGVDN